MRIRYSVDVVDFIPSGNPKIPFISRAVHESRGLSLSQAWRIVERHARRGFRLFGGEIRRANWGARGGTFPRAYRNASIRAHVG